MREATFMNFPVAEYELRFKKILAQMEKNEIDALILSSDENTYYFSGYQHNSWNTKFFSPCIITITKFGDISISVLRNCYETAFATSCIEDIRVYGENEEYKTSYEACVSLLKEKGLINKRVGLELGNGHKMHMTYDDKNNLFNELSEATVVDAGKAIWDVRKIKSKMEISFLRKISYINAFSMDRALHEVREGMTELELYRNILKYYFSLGADFTRRLGIRAGEDRYPQSNSPASERKIAKGEIILVDGGPVYKGYHSDIIRQAVIGKPSDYQLDMFNVAREACYIGIENMIPGKPIKEACEIVDKYIQNSRFADIKVYTGWSGHSLGVGVHETPMLDTRTDDVFQPGMVFAIEPYLYKADCGSLGIEENVVITETGVELLSPTNSELIIL